MAVTVVSGVGGILAHSGHTHAVTHSAILGYHMTGSVFLYGTAVGALAMLGLSLLAASVGRSSRRGLAASASLAQSRRETAAVTQHRDDLIMQRDTACAYTVLDEQRNYTASTLGDDDGSPRAGRDPGPRDPSRAGRARPRDDPPDGQKRSLAGLPIPLPTRLPPARPRLRNDS